MKNYYVLDVKRVLKDISSSLSLSLYIREKPSFLEGFSSLKKRITLLLYFYKLANAIFNSHIIFYR